MPAPGRPCWAARRGTPTGPEMHRAHRHAPDAQGGPHANKGCPYAGRPTVAFPANMGACGPTQLAAHKLGRSAQRCDRASLRGWPRRA